MVIEDIFTKSRNELETILKKNNVAEAEIQEVEMDAVESFHEGLRIHSVGESLERLKELFNGEETPSEPLYATVKTIFIKKAAGRSSLSQEEAEKIADKVIPVLIDSFSDRETGQVETKGELRGKLDLDTDVNIVDKLGGFFREVDVPGYTENKKWPPNNQR